MSDLDARRREALAGVLKRHLPKDRYDDNGDTVSTYCIGCDWTGDYFADGDAGPFDDHVADALAPLVAGWLAVCTTCQYRGGEDHPPQHPGCAAALGRIRAAALREAAEDFATGAWADAWGSDGVDDDVSAVRSTERWLLARADRVGGAQRFEGDA